MKLSENLKNIVVLNKVQFVLNKWLNSLALRVAYVM